MRHPQRRALIVGAVTWMVSIAPLSAWGQSATQPSAGRAVPTTQAQQDTRVKLAITLLYAGRQDEAIQEFQTVLAANPSHREARLGLARACFWTGKNREAMEALRPLMGEKPDAEVAELWNEIVSATGNTVEAIEAMQRALDANPDAPEVQQSTANILVRSGCYGPAIKILRELLQQHSDRIDVVLDLAHAYFTADRYAEAISLYRPYLQDPSRYGLLAQIGLARCQLKSRRLCEAAALLLGVIKTDPNEPRGHIGLIRCWVLDPETTVINPEDNLTALARPEIQRRLDERGPTREWLFALVGELVSREPNDDYRALALKLSEILAGQAETPAIRLSREVLEQFADEDTDTITPDIEPMLEGISDGSITYADIYELGNLLLALYAGQELVDLCDAALEQDPDDMATMLLRAEGLAVTVAYDDAEEAYEAILEKLPQCTKAHRGLARTYSWQRRFDKAEDHYGELIEQYPQDMALRREAARSLGWDKKIRESLDSYKDAIENIGDDPVSKKWAERLATEHNAKKAFWWGWDVEGVNYYSMAIEEEPANLEARFDLAQIYARNRHWEEAADQYERILDVDARHRRSRDALYKNGVYHHPELKVEFDWSNQEGRGDLLDVETSRMVETLKQEIARRTDLSLITMQQWHSFDKPERGSFDEYDYIARLDHRFNLDTYGHISLGGAVLDGTHDENRPLWDVALTHNLKDWLAWTVGGDRRTWIRNWITAKQGLDEERVYTKLFAEVDPWTDLYIQYARSWIENGTWWRTSQDDVVTKRNNLHELIWGANYRFSLFPRILQFEYQGTAWWFGREVPTYFSPDSFNFHLFRLNWRHYLNNDQYVEQKNLYYEIAANASIDSDGVSGWGYDAGLGWDICHHFGLEAHWSHTESSAYYGKILYLCLVARF